MAQTVLITLTLAGTDVGPFDLYSDVDGYVSAFETGVSRAALIAGYVSSSVPDGATTIKAQSYGTCTNYLYLTIDGTTTTTSTSTSSTSSTTTAAPLYTVRIFAHKMSSTQAELDTGLNDPTMSTNANTLSETCGLERTYSNVASGTTIYLMGNDGSGNWLATLPQTSPASCPTVGLFCPSPIGGNPPSFSYLITGDIDIYVSVDGDTTCP